jgi:hypothetical protein
MSIGRRPINPRQRRQTAPSGVRCPKKVCRPGLLSESGCAVTPRPCHPLAMPHRVRGCGVVPWREWRVGGRVRRAVGVATQPLQRFAGGVARAPALRPQRAGVVTRQRATDQTVKAEALRLAEERGAAEAARRTGVPAATIRSWRHRSGGAGPPNSVDPQTWAERTRAGAEDAWAAAQEALGQVRSLLADGKTADAQRAALTMAILTDKSGVLEEAAHREEERQARLTATQGRLLAELIRVYFEAVGLPLGPAARLTLAHLLRQAEAGAPLSPPAEAAEARADIRRQVGSELDVGPPLLPPGTGTGRRVCRHRKTM